MIKLSEKTKRHCERITGIAFEHLVETHEFESEKNVRGEKLSLDSIDLRIPPRGNPLFFERNKIVTMEEINQSSEKI